MAALAEQYDRFKKMGAEVITVSTDTQYVHLAWQENEKELAAVTYPMGADPTGALSRQYGVYDEGTGLALRGTFIISPEGKLLNSEVNFYNMGRNIDELMRKFKANMYLGKKQTEACPAKWKDEGDKTLAPSAAMVLRETTARLNRAEITSRLRYIKALSIVALLNRACDDFWTNDWRSNQG